MKPLNVAFIWHKHQPNERKPQGFSRGSAAGAPAVPLNGRFAISVAWFAFSAGFAALLTFPGIRCQKWTLGASDWWPRWMRGCGRDELGRPSYALFRSTL